MEENFNKNKLVSLYFFPNFINTFENFNYINYNGIILPRIYINPNNSQQINNLKISNNEFKNEEINSDKERDICVLIKDENEIDNIKDINLINEKNDNNKELVNEDKISFFNNNNLDNQLNILLKEKKDNEPIPPKIFISIINDNKNILNTTDNNNYKYINNIISDNINLITYEINKNITNNIIPPTIFNQFNNQILPSPLSFSFFQENNKKPYFYTLKKKRLNPKRKKYLNKVIEQGLKLNNRIHLASDDDNLVRKIQVHFLSFVVSYINDVIKTVINDKNAPLFKNLDYQIKKRVKHSYVNELRNKTIAEILQLKVSPKMKIHDDSVNKNIYSTICKMSPFMAIYLQQSYVSLFKEYYINKSRIFIVDRKIVKLSIKTKTFNDLILKNIQYKEKLKKIANNYFLNTYKRIKKPYFMALNIK